MTSPPARIEVTCGCGHQFEAWHRPSINVGLGEEWTADQIAVATTTKCPECSTVIGLGSWIIDREES